MYLDYFCLGKPLSSLFKIVKEEDLIYSGNQLNYWDPLWGNMKVICKHIKIRDEVYTLFVNEKGKQISYPIKGKFFVGKYYKCFQEKFVLLGGDNSVNQIVLGNYSSIIPKLIKSPQTMKEIVELLDCDPRFLSQIDIKNVYPIIKNNPNFLNDLENVIASAIKRIMDTDIEFLSKEDLRVENKLKKRYIKEVQSSWKDLLREVKHSNTMVNMGKDLVL